MRSVRLWTTGGVRAVLTGGSAATYWAPEVYQSRDADFVLNFGTDQRSIVEIMRNLGYRSNEGTWVHERSVFTVEFPPGPLAIGNYLVNHYETIDHKDGWVLHILTPEDSVRDRLAHFIHWSDRTALSAAVGVAKNHRQRIDFAAIRRWAAGEHREGPQRFSEFERAFRSHGFERGIGR